MEKSKDEKIHEKGFNISGSHLNYENINEYNKIRVGTKQLEDAVLNLGSLQDAMGPNHIYTNKKYIIQALMHKDMSELRAISNFYYDVNGVYEKVCNYLSHLYRYDWFIAPEVLDKAVKEERVLKDFAKVLHFFDNSYIKKMCGEIALEVIKNGCYYGYIIPSKDRLTLQQLPVEYCRSRYSKNNAPVIEFNMKFFDTFSDIEYRMKILNLFPEEFKKGYVLYKQNKLIQDGGFKKVDSGWYLLDPNNTVKFNLNNSDVPTFINAIPALLDLDAAQDLDRRKQMQKLLKIIVQKLPLDKNGDLIFDVDEARDIHNNGVQMLQRAIGVDVLTTFTDVDSIDLSDKNTTTSTDDLAKVERAVFNAFGISQNLFNTDGNLSLEKSILNDESSVRDLLQQFIAFFDKFTEDHFSNTKYCFNFYMLETTQYNFKEMSKLYKEQTQLGYSKMLPQVALGHSQSFILNSAHFENEVLHLSEIMIPPLMSSTMSGEDLLGKNRQNDKTNPQNKTEQNKKIQKITEDKSVGRPEKSDDQKSEKTIQNKESMS